MVRRSTNLVSSGIHFPRIRRHPEAASGRLAALRRHRRGVQEADEEDVQDAKRCQSKSVCKVNIGRADGGKLPEAVENVKTERSGVRVQLITCQR